MALVHINALSTSYGEKMKLTAEQEKVCKVLYLKSEDNTGYKFAGFYDPDIPDEKYTDGLVAVPLRSVFGGTYTFHKNDSVWNVSGSTGDEYVYSNNRHSTTWIDVWDNEANKSKLYDIKCYVEGSVKSNGKSNCGGGICGGHMIISSIQPNWGDDGVVYIVPICSSHNHYQNVAQMRICETVEALVLNNYHQTNKDITGHNQT